MGKMRKMGKNGEKIITGILIRITTTIIKKQKKKKPFSV